MINVILKSNSLDTLSDWANNPKVDVLKYDNFFDKCIVGYENDCFMRFSAENKRDFKIDVYEYYNGEEVPIATVAVEKTKEGFTANAEIHDKELRKVQKGVIIENLQTYVDTMIILNALFAKNKDMLIKNESVIELSMRGKSLTADIMTDDYNNITKILSL